MLSRGRKKDNESFSAYLCTEQGLCWCTVYKNKQYAWGNPMAILQNFDKPFFKLEFDIKFEFYIQVMF